MPSVEVRKRVTIVEEFSTKAARSPKTPYRRAAILAVIKNPFAGRYVEEIVGFIRRSRSRWGSKWRRR